VLAGVSQAGSVGLGGRSARRGLAAEEQALDAEAGIDVAVAVAKGLDAHAGGGGAERARKTRGVLEDVHEGEDGVARDPTKGG
jgi:hypothetical protein